MLDTMTIKELLRIPAIWTHIEEQELVWGLNHSILIVSAHKTPEGEYRQ